MENDPAAREELTSLGYRIVPVTVVREGGAVREAVVGFNPSALARAVGLPPEGARRADRSALERLDLFLEAVGRAVLQVPPDKLDWRSPDRDRTLRTFGAHIFFYISYVLDAGERGEFRQEPLLEYDQRAAAFSSAGEIARFGEGVRERLRAFARSLSGEVMERPVDSYMGPLRYGELWDLALVHTAHHLRQLYAFLRMVGVEPRDPLPPEAFEGIEAPSALF